ncbi:hypothetical protein A2U01_0074467, partial [Trifolium medium]|nr:hypothetical protein [Trifolium medium]
MLARGAAQAYARRSYQKTNHPKIIALRAAQLPLRAAQLTENHRATNQQHYARRSTCCARRR